MSDNICRDVGDLSLFKCSKCGCELDIYQTHYEYNIMDDYEDSFDEPTMWVDGKSSCPSFCPHCGRKISED